MTWGIGKCERCHHPRGNWYACVFKVRVRRFPSALFDKWARRWAWWCDDCTQLRFELHRLHKRK